VTIEIPFVLESEAVEDDAVDEHRSVA
jgi:hypothetical protein